MIPQELIESALQLMGKTMEDMEEYEENEIVWIFSIEKFCYYLLDRKFIIKYYQNQKPWYTPSIETTDLMAGEFWYAIMEYQFWQEQPLIQLLTPICKTTNND